MSRTRHITAAVLAGLALAAAGCDNDDDESPARTDDSPVNTDTPQNTPGDTTPAPEGSETLEDAP